MSLYRTFALSDHWFAKAARSCHRNVTQFAFPAPKVIFIPILMAVLALRQLWYFAYRVFFCEPLFKAYCQEYGKNLHTGVYFHWVQGEGKLVLGDNVLVDGKCSFCFAARFSEAPTLSIGDNTVISHGCTFVIGKKIAIGNNCKIASGAHLFDSPGHPQDPEKRQAGFPPDAEDVRPITIGNNVWLGTGAIVFPGVTVGDNSIVSAHAVVMSDVPPNVVVAGNPARKILSFDSPRTAPASDAPRPPKVEQTI
jgi:acetyltransferase-like isoleucine patch superfamily enzyme